MIECLLWLYNLILDRQTLLKLLRVQPTLCSVSAAFTLSSLLDVACLEVTFENVFVSKDRPSCKSGARGKLTVKNILGYVAMLHKADMAKPA